jgi:hypothetical protein
MDYILATILVFLATFLSYELPKALARLIQSKVILVALAIFIWIVSWALIYYFVYIHSESFGLLLNLGIAFFFLIASFLGLIFGLIKNDDKKLLKRK